MPPDLVEVTVEKVAINAVMAGCKPEYLPWVIAAVEAVCTDEFNIHGVLATTMPVGPVIICNGPGTRAIGMNSGVNVLGQGNRANLTIGRAVQLVVRNVGGGRPGGVDRATHGNPGKISFCFAEDEEASPFTSLATSLGFARRRQRGDGVRRRGPALHRRSARSRSRVSWPTRSPRACARCTTRSWCSASTSILVVGPEHARVFAEAGWDRERVLAELHARLQIPGSELVRGAGGMAEGVPEHLRDATLPQVPPGRHPARPRRRRRRAVLGDRSAAGPTATSGPSRSP